MHTQHTYTHRIMFSLSEDGQMFMQEYLRSTLCFYNPCCIGVFLSPCLSCFWVLLSTSYLSRWPAQVLYSGFCWCQTTVPAPSSKLQYQLWLHGCVVCSGICVVSGKVVRVNVHLMINSEFEQLKAVAVCVLMSSTLAEKNCKIFHPLQVVAQTLNSTQTHPWRP